MVNSIHIFFIFAVGTGSVCNDAREEEKLIEENELVETNIVHISKEIGRIEKNSSSENCNSDYTCSPKRRVNEITRTGICVWEC